MGNKLFSKTLKQAVGPIQPLFQWVQGFFTGGWASNARWWPLTSS